MFIFYFQLLHYFTDRLGLKDVSVLKDVSEIQNTLVCLCVCKFICPS